MLLTIADACVYFLRKDSGVISHKFFKYFLFLFNGFLKTYFCNIESGNDSFLTIIPKIDEIMFILE